MSRPPITDEIVHLLRAGESPSLVAVRLGRGLDSCARALHRAGLTDDARAFWREAHQRKVSTRR